MLKSFFKILLFNIFTYRSNDVYKIKKKKKKEKEIKQSLKLTNIFKYRQQKKYVPHLKLIGANEFRQVATS